MGDCRKRCQCRYTWQFGDQNSTWDSWVAKLYSEYRKLKPPWVQKQTWVAAYTDDVFAYVASERMRAEGGYEVDSSMIYYLQPGRWQAGTQALMERSGLEKSVTNHTPSRTALRCRSLGSGSAYRRAIASNWSPARNHFFRSVRQRCFHRWKCVGRRNGRLSAG